jgi:hypothetical protein
VAKKRSEKTKKVDKGPQPGGCGCLLVVYVIAGSTVAIFFPGTREGALIRPAVSAWEALFGEIPSIRLWTTMLSIGILGLGGLVGFVIGHVAALATSSGKSETDFQKWQLICAVIGLFLTALGLIF